MADEEQVSTEKAQEYPGNEIAVATDEFYRNFIPDSINVLRTLEAHDDLTGTVQFFVHSGSVEGTSLDGKVTKFVLLSLTDEVHFYAEPDLLTEMLKSLEGTDYRLFSDPTLQVVDTEKNPMNGTLHVLYNGKLNEGMIKFVEQTKQLTEKLNAEKKEATE